MGELKRIASNSAILVAARVLGMLSGLGAVLLMSRQLELADLGAMLLCMSVSAILSAFASLNVESVAIRYIVQYRESGHMRGIAGFHAFGTGAILLFTTAALLAATLDAAFLGYGLFELFWFSGVFAAPLFALIRLNGEIVSANGDVLAAVIPRTFARPIMFFAGLALFSSLFEGPLTLELAVLAFYGALALVAAAQVFLIAPRRLGLARPSLRAWAQADFSDWRAWSVGGLGLVLPYLFIEYSTDLILVAATLAIAEPEVAILGVLLRIVALHRFVTVAIGQAAAPQIARAYMRDERKRLALILSVSAAASAAVQAAAIVAHLLIGDLVLGIFGAEFAGFRIELAVLAIMALIVALFGQTTRLAAIVDLKGYVTLVYVGALAALVGLVAAFGAAFGLLGVVAAPAVVWLGWNWLLWRRIRAVSGVDTSMVGSALAWRALRRSERAAGRAAGQPAE